MQFDKTATRLWKRLTREERAAAATHLFAESAPELLGTALAAIIKARKLRPQVARALPHAEQASMLAGVLEPGEGLAASLLVALHLGERRPLLRAFLDAQGLPHEDGILKDDEDAPVDPAKLREAVARLYAEQPREQVTLYLNTLWLQDVERWGSLADLEAPPA
jgi:hypothetical protein